MLMRDGTLETDRTEGQNRRMVYLLKTNACLTNIVLDMLLRSTRQGVQSRTRGKIEFKMASESRFASVDSHAIGREARLSDPGLHNAHVMSMAWQCERSDKHCESMAFQTIE